MSHLRESGVEQFQGCVLLVLTDMCHMAGWKGFELYLWDVDLFCRASDVCERVLRGFTVVLVSSVGPLEAQFGQVMSSRFWAQSQFEMKPRQTEICGSTCE